MNFIEPPPSPGNIVHDDPLTRRIFIIVAIVFGVLFIYGFGKGIWLVSQIMTKCNNQSIQQQGDK